MIEATTKKIIPRPKKMSSRVRLGSEDGTRTERRGSIATKVAATPNATSYGSGSSSR